MNINAQITETFENAAETAVDANQRLLDTVVDVNRRLVDTAVRINQNVADRAPEFELPMVGQLPTPAEAGARYIDFVERAVSINRDFTAKAVAQLPTGIATAAKAKATKAAK